MPSEKLKFKDDEPQEKQLLSHEDLVERKKEIFQDGDDNAEAHTGIEESEYKKFEEVTNLTETEWEEREKTRKVLKTKIAEIKKAFNGCKDYIPKINDDELKECLELVYRYTIQIENELDNLDSNNTAYRGNDLIHVLGNFNGGAKILQRLADPKSSTTENSPLVIAFKKKMKSMFEFMSEYEDHPERILEDIRSVRWPKYNGNNKK